MPFKRVWDASCPRKYDQWEADGVSFVIQDLPPEDEETALKLLVEDFVSDELLCQVNEIGKDPISLHSLTQCWRHHMSQRMTLACYAEKNGVRTLAAFNCLLVECQGEKIDFPGEGEAWKNVHAVLSYIDDHCDAFKHLGLDKLLYALGLVVKRDYRGARIGSRMLAAREPLCRSLGIKGSSTLFTGVASQKSAARVGFTTIYEVSLRELADAGLKYPQDDRVIKVMVKKYDD